MGYTLDLDWLASLREFEIDFVFDRISVARGCRLLEVGSGSGHQARLLERRGFQVSAVDVPDSNYAASRVFPIIDYDGHRLPFGDSEFDVVFSSNVLEHVPHLAEFDAELSRVLKPNGLAVHVLPSHVWRLWTSLSHYPHLAKRCLALATSAFGSLPNRSSSSKASPDTSARQDPSPLPLKVANLMRAMLVSGRHGARGTELSEYTRYFRPHWWGQHFASRGWTLEQHFDLGVFYTGYMLFGRRVALHHRATLAKALGGSVVCFCLRRPALHERQGAS